MPCALTSPPRKRRPASKPPISPSLAVPATLAFRWCWRSPKGLPRQHQRRQPGDARHAQSSRIPFIENDAEPLLRKALADKRLFFTSPPSISTSGPVIITIGTPVDEFLNPVRGVVQECIDALLPHLPTVSFWCCVRRSFPAPPNGSRLPQRKGRKLKVAFCPERIVQGHGLRGAALCRRSSAAPRRGGARSGRAVRQIAPQVVVMKPIEAEFAKLFTNAYRYIEFAITNQFYLIAKTAGVDYHRVFEGHEARLSARRHIPCARLRGRALPV